MGVFITEEYNVMFNIEKLIGITVYLTLQTVSHKPLSLLPGSTVYCKLWQVYLDVKYLFPFLFFSTTCV